MLCAGSKPIGVVDTFRSILISYWFDNLGFITERNLLLHSSYLSLEVSQRTCVSRAIKHIFWRLCQGCEVFLRAPLTPTSAIFSGAGNIKPAARGVSHFQPFYFVIVLLSLLLLCLVFFIYQKSKKNSYLHLVYFSVPYHV